MKKENNAATPKKIRLDALRRFNPLNNNYALMALSVVIAFIIWLSNAMSQLDQETVTKVIYDVPLVYTIAEGAAQQGLSIVESSETQKTVSVTISGHSYVLNSVTANDLSATAKPSGVVSAGTYTSEVSVVNVSNKEFSVVGWNPRIMNVQLDRTSTQSFELTVADVIYSPASGYTLKTPTLADESVEITGPEQELQNIAYVVAEADIPAIIQETATYDAEIHLYDQYGTELEQSAFTMSINKTEITIVVMKIEDIPIEVDFKNMPADFDKSRITVNPDTVLLTGVSEIFDHFSQLNIGTLDFKNVTVDKHEFNYNITNILPSGCENQEKVEAVTVSVNMEGMCTKEFAVSQIQFASEEDAQKKCTVLSRAVPITVTGTEEEINALSEKNFVLLISPNQLDKSDGKYELNATVQISGASDSNVWVNGTPTVFVQVGSGT